MSTRIRFTFLLSLLLTLFSFHYASAQLMADAGPDQQICEGDTADLNGMVLNGGPFASPVAWTCNLPFCNFQSTSSPMTRIADLPAGCTELYFTVFDFFGPADVDTLIICVEPNPVINAGPNQAICPPPAPGVLLSASLVSGAGPFSYTWFPGAGLNDSTLLNPFARPVISTTYTLVATDLVSGCSSDPMDSLSQVLVEVNNAPVADGGPDQVICQGDSTILQGLASGAGPLYDYNWSPSTGLSDPLIPNPTAAPNSTTSYIFTAISNGCPSFPDTVEVTVIPLPATPTITQNGDTLVASLASQYQWCLNGNPIPGATSQQYIPLVGGNYQVKAIDPTWGCASLPSSTVTDRENSRRTGPEVGPVPALDGRVKLEWPDFIGSMELELISLNGQVLAFFSAEGPVTVLDLSAWKGWFLLRIQGNGEQFVQKVWLP